MPISISDTIDVRYRLQPQDLGGEPRPVLVRNVTLEGIEYLTPLVHFEGLARPLALDLDQRIQIAEIARSNLLVDWIGLPLILRPEHNRGFDSIRLVGIKTQRARPHPFASNGWLAKPGKQRRMRQLLLVLLVIAVVCAVYIAVQTTGALDTLPALFNP